MSAHRHSLVGPVNKNKTNLVRRISSCSRVTPAGIRLLVDHLDAHRPASVGERICGSPFTLPVAAPQPCEDATVERRRRDTARPATATISRRSSALTRRGPVGIQRRARNLQQPALRHDRQISLKPARPAAAASSGSWTRPFCEKNRAPPLSARRSLQLPPLGNYASINDPPS